MSSACDTYLRRTSIVHVAVRSVRVDATLVGDRHPYAAQQPAARARFCALRQSTHLVLLFGARPAGSHPPISIRLRRTTKSLASCPRRAHKRPRACKSLPERAALQLRATRDRTRLPYRTLCFSLLWPAHCAADTDPGRAMPPPVRTAARGTR